MEEKKDYLDNIDPETTDAADENDTIEDATEPSMTANLLEDNTNEKQADAQEKNVDEEKSFCVNCGVEIPADCIFCPKCGHKVGERLKSENNLVPVTPKNNKKIGLIIGALVAVIAVIVAVFLIRGVQAKDVTLNKESISVKMGESVTLSYTINPSDTKDKSVSWSSSNESIAQVTNGTVTGINEGDCTITVSTKNGKTDTCSVTILSAGPDLQSLYNEHCSSTYATIASDGSYLNIDTNPSDKDDYTDYEAYLSIVAVNEALELPESVINRMNQTRSLDGIQTYSTDELDISWTYHPDKGLEVIYALK